MKWRKVRKGEIIILLSLCFLIFFPRREGNFSPNSFGRFHSLARILNRVGNFCVFFFFFSLPPLIHERKYVLRSYAARLTSSS